MVQPSKHRVLRLLVAGAALALALAAAALALPAESAASTAQRQCFERDATIRKTSLSVHQWTVHHASRWCSELVGDRWRIVSVDRDTRVETGTNWRLVGRGGGTEYLSHRIAEGWSRWHFRLRYPNFEQHCRPRITITMTAGGESNVEKRVGC